MSTFRTFESRLIAAVHRAARQLASSDSALETRQILTAMYKDFLDEGSYFIEQETGFKAALNPSFDSIKDDLDEAFFKAIETEEQAAEDARDGWLIAAARADEKREREHV